MARRIDHFKDCLSHESGEAVDCDCAQRDADAFDIEMDARVDRLRDDDAAYERRERDRDRAS